MSAPMRYIGVVSVVFIGTIIAILLASGKLLASEDAWKGLGLLLLGVSVMAAFGWVVYAALRGEPLPKEQALAWSIGVAIGAILFLVLLMGAGREWLEPIWQPFKEGGLWWPVVTFVMASVAYWLAQPDTFPEGESADNSHGGLSLFD